MHYDFTAIPDTELERIGKYLDEGGRLLALFNFNSANNHFLNSLLAKMASAVGGPSVDGSRLPGPAIACCSSAPLLKTGSTPGRAILTASAWVLGSEPNAVEAPEKILVLVWSWTWVSSPMTAS